MSIIIDTPTRISRLLASFKNPAYIFSGSRTVDPGRELNEDGTFALNEDGSYILLENPVYVLNENGSYALKEDGTRELAEGSSPADGTATPLLSVSTACQYVSVAAKLANYGTIWISGSDAAEGVGIPLYIRNASILIPIDDVSKVYIWGNVGDGVTFFYGTVSLPSDLTFLGSPLTFGGSSLSQ